MLRPDLLPSFWPYDRGVLWVTYLSCTVVRLGQSLHLAATLQWQLHCGGTSKSKTDIFYLYLINTQQYQLFMTGLTSELATLCFKISWICYGSVFCHLVIGLGYAYCSSGFLLWFAFFAIFCLVVMPIYYLSVICFSECFYVEPYLQHAGRKY